MTFESSILLLSGLLVVSCKSSEGCETSADCPSIGGKSGACVQDVDRGDSYCSNECAESNECPEGHFCLVEDAGEPGVCLDLVRDCTQSEACNGLDDDCDGQADEGCEALVCFSDAQCGLFACVMPSVDDEQQTRECEPPVGEGLIGDFCSSSSDCYNNACVGGECLPACGTCFVGEACASAQLESRLELTVCYESCGSSLLCDPPKVCRPLPGTGDLGAAVCTAPLGKLEYGDSCVAPEDCDTGICQSGRCSRLCSCPGCAPGDTMCIPSCGDDCPGADCDPRNIPLIDDSTARVSVCVF